MANKSFIIADVFTGTQFGGNQLAVFTDGSGLDQATMLNLAREMNYSETTFLLPPKSTGDFHLRIFTPHEELPFAGHPCVGSGYVIVAQKMKEWGAAVTDVRFETGVGEILVSVETKNGKPGFTKMTQPLPVVQSTFGDSQRLARALSLDVKDLPLAKLPAQVLFNGVPVLLIPVATLKAVESIRPDANALVAICLEIGAKTVMAFTLETLASTSTVHSRVFAPVQSILEDAATGSANGPLGVYLVHNQLVEVLPKTRIISEQGFEMHRPSLLTIEIDVEPSTNQATAVCVGGDVVISGRGEIFI